MTVYFAWVDLVDGNPPPFSAAHHVEDEDVFGFQVSHSEGEFPQLSLEVRNPGGGLLAPGRKRWAWLSRDMGSGPVPLFFGRLVGTPEQIAEETQRLILIARPRDWRQQKETLAAGLRTLPQFDPIWIAEDVRDDPDMVLQARSALWHTDRITGQMTVSDFVVGEAGPTAVNHFRDSLQTRYVTGANRKVSVAAEVIWDQTARGSVDITDALLSAARDAGSPYSSMIGTYTGEGLIRDWPEIGTNIGGGWEVGFVSLDRYDGSATPRRHLIVNAEDGSSGRFPLWAIRPRMRARFDVARQYVERVSFEIASQIQPLVTGADEDDPIEIKLQSSAVSEPIDGVVPIGDVRRRSYFQTDRGRASLEHLVERARAVLRSQARAVEVLVDIPFAEAVGLSCRHSVTVADARLPGESATGKVTSYLFGIDGSTGEAFGRVAIGCTIGLGGSLSVTPPSLGYVQDDYVDAGYDALEGGDTALETNDTAWSFSAPVEVQDDGVLLDALTPASSIILFSAENMAPTQAAAITGPFADLTAAASAMNEVPTRFTLQMRVLDGLAFETDYTLTVADLVLPKTIDLEAA